MKLRLTYIVFFAGLFFLASCDKKQVNPKANSEDPVFVGDEIIINTDFLPEDGGIKDDDEEDGKSDIVRKINSAKLKN